jgi:hypothetical protein
MRAADHTDAFSFHKLRAALSVERDRYPPFGAVKGSLMVSIMTGQNRVFGIRDHLGRQEWPGRLGDSQASPISRLPLRRWLAAPRLPELAGLQPSTRSHAVVLAAAGSPTLGRCTRRERPWRTR